jgi:hypothetical protein
LDWAVGEGRRERGQRKVGGAKEHSEVGAQVTERIVLVKFFPTSGTLEWKEAISSYLAVLLSLSVSLSLTCYLTSQAQFLQFYKMGGYRENELNTGPVVESRGIRINFQ